MQKWQLQKAKAKFSEVVKKSQKAPQIISVRGEELSVLVSKDYFSKKLSKKQNFVDFMESSPLNGLNLKIKRNKSALRDIKL